MRLTLAASLVAMALMSFSFANDVRASIRQTTNIPAESLDSALRSLAKQHNFQIVYVSEQVNNLRTRGAIGEFTPEEALKHLLKGTGLTFKYLDANTITIEDSSPTSSAPRGLSSEDSGTSMMRLAGNPGTETPPTGNTPSATDASDHSSPGASGGPALDEVVVTATRRNEREQEVPISLTSFNRQTLDTRSVRQIDDLAALSPGVTFVRNGTSAAGNGNDEMSDISIRGVDSTAGTSTTGIYLDDTPIQSRHIGYGTQNAYPVVFDLDRVEVLRGPQGTLFGASSEGGTVRFIQPAPSLTESTAYLRSELGTTKHGDTTYDEGGAFGAPIIDDVLGFRVSASYRRDGGWVDRVNYATGEVNEANSNWKQTTSVHAALTWKPIDTLTITPSFYYQELFLNDTSASWQILSDPGAESFKNGNAQPDQSRDPFYIAALHADWQMGWAELVSNTSFYSRNQYTHSDYTQFVNELYLGVSFYEPNTNSGAYLTDTQNNFYEELRLQSVDSSARFTWTTGVFYAHMNENGIENITAPTLNAASGGAVCATFPCPGGLIYAEPYNRVIDKQVALFGEAVMHITDSFKATGGLRVSRDSFVGQSLVGGPFLGQENIQTNSPVTVEDPVTPKGVLSWQPDRDDLFYLSAEKGFRVGGINSGVGNACAANLALIGVPAGANGQRAAPGSYGSDSLWSYELGAKNTLFDQRLQINSSLFWIDWSNIQQNVPLSQCGLQYTANLGKVRSVGGDISLLMRPIDPLTISLTAAFTDAKYTKTVCATAAIACTGPDAVGAPIVSAGDRLQGAPWKFTATADYIFNPIFAKKPYLHLDYNRTNPQTSHVPYQDPRNGGSDPEVGSLPLTSDLSARAGLRWNGIDVSVYGNNLTDEHPIISSNRDYDAANVIEFNIRSVQPRSFGITATYRY